MRKNLLFKFCMFTVLIGCVIVYVAWNLKGRMSDRTLEYFFSLGHLKRRDAAEVRWSHAVNSRIRLTEALIGPTHMIEADVIIRGRDPREPILAHPPDTDSDITVREFLEGLIADDRGIKLDFKSLEAVSPCVALLKEVLAQPGRPVWINADILPGPGGQAKHLEPHAFLSAVRSLPTHTVLSLGWTTGTGDAGYSWDMVREMEEICRPLPHPVTFPVRAALLRQSFPQLTWLLQQSDSYTLTVWTGQSDEYTVQDLLPYRKEVDIRRIYYDLPDAQRTELSMTYPDN